jgi:sugar phosphate isomerase/epimerase
MLLSSNSGFYSFRAGEERYPFTESLRFLSRAGFEAVDVNFCAVIYHEKDQIEMLLLADDWREKVEEIGRLAGELGLRLYMSHLPFFEYGNLDDPERKFRFDMTERALEASAMLGISWAVVHPSNLPDYETAKKATNEYLDFVLKKAESVGIAIENMPRPAGYFGSDIESLCRLIDERGEQMGLCFDSGHLHKAGGSMAEAINAIGGRLKTLHLHDNFGDADRHLPPFMGTIDWKALAGALRQIDYQGDLNFEVGPLKHPELSEEIRERHARYVVSAGRVLLNMIHRG